jgi:3-oxoacyl-[acyl-carrier protein] reductase
VKTVLVSGGSGEIGVAICRRLARSGWRVVVHAHRQGDRAAALAGEIAAAGGSAQAVTFDVTDPLGTSSALSVLLELGPIQGVVHNAGIHDDAPMAGMSATQWDGSSA